MRSILRDFKDAPAVWGAVFMLLTFVQVTICTLSLMWWSSLTHDASDPLGDAGLMQRKFMFDLIASLIVSIIVVMQVVSSAVGQRSRNLAMLALQGATPLQMTITTCTQVMVLDLAATTVSFISFPMARLLFPFLTEHMEIPAQVFVSNNEPIAWVLGALSGFVAAIFGALLTVRAASRISPVEALRDAMNPPKAIGKLRGVMSVLSFLAACLMILPMLLTKPLQENQMTLQNLVDASAQVMSQGILSAVPLIAIICLAGPVMLPATVKVLSSILRFPSATWKIACQQAKSRVRTSSSTIIPMVAGLSLLMMFTTASATWTATMDKLPESMRGESASFSRLLVFTAPELVIVMAAICAGYLISVQSRKLDLALVSIQGAEPKQQFALSALDGLIIVMVSVALSFAISTFYGLAFTFTLWRVTGVFELGIPWIPWLIVFATLGVPAMIASWLTVRSSLNLPAVTVIARRVGE
jgi:putative ABC transport system permease protein